jgi:hypothetical protein
LVDSITTNRESFYVTVSRAKHHLGLYTTNKIALAELAQKTKAKENVSDYIPLFQVVPNHAQTSQIKLQSVPASGEHRDLAKRVGARVGERIAQKLAADRQRLTTDRSGTDCPASASESSGAANSADVPNVAAFASTLEPHIESLSDTIASFLEQRDFIKCAGDLAQAVTAVNCSLEYLEQSTENRTKLAAAINRLDAAVRTKTRQLESVQQSTSEQFQQYPKSVAEPINAVGSRQGSLQLYSVKCYEQSLTSIKDISSSMSYSIPSIPFKETRQNSRELYQQMWQRYSQNVQACTPVTLDYLVARRAFEEGRIPKEIAFMLTVGSPYVAQIHQKQGKDKVRAYVSQTVKAACQQKQEQKLTKGKQKERQLEL